MSASVERWLDAAREMSLWTLIGWAGLAFTIIFSIFKLPYFMAPGFDSVLRETGQHISVLVWLLVLTTFNRTVRLRTLVAFWFLGIYPAFALAVVVGRPMASIFGLNGHFVPDLWVPVTEELIKALPVLLYLAWSAWGGTFQTSATDGLLLGLAVGSGFAMHEDIVDRRVGGSGFGSGSILTRFFPTAWVSPSHAQFILGHAGWTGLIGLALGVAFLLRRSLVVWVVPVVAFAVVSLDHMTTNYISGLGRDSMPWFIRASYRMLLHDRLPATLLLLGIFGVIALEQWILRWASERDQMFLPMPLERITAMVSPRPDFSALRAAREYIRFRRAAHYAAWTWQFGGVPSAEVTDGMARVISAFGFAAGGASDVWPESSSPRGVIVAEPMPSES